MLKKIIIGVDIRDLRIAGTGTKTYLEELCSQFKKMDGIECKFYFFDTFLPVYKGKNKLLKFTEHIRFQLWKQFLLPVKAGIKRCDVVFCTDFFVPYLHLGFSTVPVFHDAFFFEYPSHYNKIWLWLFKKTAVPAARRSAFIITPSYYVKEKVTQYTHIHKDKIIPVYEAAKTFGNDDVNTFDQHRQNAQLKYIFHVGVLDKRKNLTRLIQAFKLLVDEGNNDLFLILAGQPGTKIFSNDLDNIKDTITKNNLTEKIILTGYLSDIELAFYYKHAFLYVFPSLNEGFGIPVLEAFGFDVPVLIANNSSLPEIGGEAVVSFDPLDITDIAKKIRLALNDEKTRNEMIANGRKRVKDFSWEKAAKELIQLFTSIRK